MSELLGTIRASSWPELFDCSYRWYWKNIFGLRSPSGGRAALGTAIHAGTAVFDAAVLAGAEPSIDAAIDATLGSLDNPLEDIDWDPEDLTLRDAGNFGVRLTTRYCQEIAPFQTYLAVEVKCPSLDIDTDHGVIRLTGTTDRVRQVRDGRKGIADLKSGSRATEFNEDGRTRRAVTKGHHLQLGVYTLMAEQELREPLDAPAQIVGLQASKEAPVATGECADVKTPLLGTDDKPGLIHIAAGMLKGGVFPPNPKSTLCSKKYCPAHGSRCHFHD